MEISRIDTDLCLWYRVLGSMGNEESRRTIKYHLALCLPPSGPHDPSRGPCRVRSGFCLSLQLNRSASVRSAKRLCWTGFDHCRYLFNTPTVCPVSNLSQSIKPPFFFLQEFIPFLQGDMYKSGPVSPCGGIWWGAHVRTTHNIVVYAPLWILPCLQQIMIYRLQCTDISESAYYAAL